MSPSSSCGHTNRCEFLARAERADFSWLNSSETVASCPPTCLCFPPALFTCHTSSAFSHLPDIAWRIRRLLRTQLVNLVTVCCVCAQQSQLKRTEDACTAEVRICVYYHCFERKREREREKRKDTEKMKDFVCAVVFATIILCQGKSYFLQK